MRKWIIRQFTASLRNRLFLYLTLSALLPLIISGMIIFTASDRRLKESTLKSAENGMLKAVNSSDTIMNQAEELSRRIYEDSVIQVFAGKEIGRFQIQQAEEVINMELRNLNQEYEDIAACYLMLDNGIYGKSQYYDFMQKLLLPRRLLENAHEHSYFEWIRSLNGSLISNNGGHGVLTALTAYVDYDSGRTVGVIAIEIRLQLLNDIMNVQLGKKGSMYICDGIGNVQAGRIRNLEQVALAQKIARKKIGNSDIKEVEFEGYYCMIGRLSSNGWTVIGILDKGFLGKNGREIFLLMLSIFFLLTAINIFISDAICRYEIFPLKRLREYIGDVERGFFGQKLISVRADEVGVLTESIRQMSVNIGKLMETIKQEEEVLRLTEFKALQAQINPHFLYNTLDSISWLILSQNNEQAYGMLKALTSYFRISLSRGEDLIAIEDETEHVKNYLTIQKMRFTNLFEFQIFFDSELRGYKVPKLILQPIVENALYHGVKECDRVNQIFVNLLREKDHMICEVRDDGIGMDEEQLNRLRSVLNTGCGNESGGYGLRNVNERIQILAGKEYGIQVESEKGFGTSVKIILPLMMKYRIES